MIKNSRVNILRCLILIVSLLLAACSTTKDVPPSSPSNVTIQAQDSQIVISWNSVDGATSYNIYLASEADVNKTNYQSKTAGQKVTDASSPHTVSGLTNGTTYYFVVTALKGSLESTESNEKSATPTASASPPDAPSNVAATAKDGAVEITWDASSEATSYNLYFSSEAGVTKDNYQSKTNGQKVEQVTSPYTQSGLTNGTTYYFVVTGVNPAGESTESAEASATPAAQGQQFNPTEDTKLSAGDYDFDSINIPEGVKVTLEGEVTFNVSGNISIAGTLKSDCKALSLLGKGDISITGEVDNSCSDNSEPGDLTIKTDGGLLNIGTLDEPANLGSSGEVDITNADDLEDWEFDVLPDQRSESKLAPVCSATSDTLWDTVVPGFPIEVDFSGDGVDPDGGPVSYQWDFGDGGSSTVQDPVHNYESHGVFDVTLTVTDDDNESCTATLRVVMDDGESEIPAESALWIEPDTLVMEANQELGFISFYDDPQNQTVSYKWDFGDGSTSTAATPRHKYTAAGRYEVSLEITDTDQNVSTATAAIYAHSVLEQSSLKTAQLPPNACLGVPAGYRVFNVVFDGGKAAQGRNGKNKRYRGRGNVILGSLTNIKAQDGGDGKDRSGVGDVQGGKGGRGGSLLIHVAGNLIVCEGAEFGNGDGGKGGSATATGKKPWAKGGNGGPAGRKLSVKATTGLDFQAPFGFPIVFNPGSGGPGGPANGKADPGANGCNVAEDGGTSMARGGNGGKGSKVARTTGNVGGTGNILVEGGNGGDGANSKSEGGAGGTANCAGNAIGGNGGGAISHGGHGGPAQFSNLAGLSTLAVAPDAFTGGDGGNSISLSGAGGPAVATPSGPCAASTATGGDSKKAESTGGKGGKGANDGKGGDADAKGNMGGSAKATGGDCPNCGDGGPAAAYAGDGSDAEANFGEGPSGNNGTAKAEAGEGGDSEAQGGHGGDCNVCPEGKGGDGGSGEGKGGNGGEAEGNGVKIHGGGGDSDVKGGNGGDGANCCPPDVPVPMPGGDGGNGGPAISHAGTSKDPAKIGNSGGKSGDGGDGGDGWPKAGKGGAPGAVVGTPTKPAKGAPGVDGILCPPQQVVTLDVDTSGSGTGSVTVDPPMPAGGYPKGTKVTITAVPGPNSVFDSWGGGASGSNSVVMITMDGNKSVIAKFVKTYGLKVDAEGNGTVNVDPSPNAPNNRYKEGTVVTLMANPAQGSELKEWEGDCAGSTGDTCTLTMDGDKMAKAIFGPPQLGACESLFDKFRTNIFSIGEIITLNINDPSLHLLELFNDPNVEQQLRQLLIQMVISFIIINDLANVDFPQPLVDVEGGFGPTQNGSCNIAAMGVGPLFPESNVEAQFDASIDPSTGVMNAIYVLGVNGTIGGEPVTIQFEAQLAAQ